MGEGGKVVIDLDEVIRAEAKLYVEQTATMTDEQLEAYHRLIAETADHLYLAGKDDSDKVGSVLINYSDPATRKTNLLACFWAGNAEQFNRLLDTYGSREARAARDYLAAQVVNSAN